MEYKFFIAQPAYSRYMVKYLHMYTFVPALKENTKYK